MVSGGALQLPSTLLFSSIKRDILLRRQDVFPGVKFDHWTFIYHGHLGRNEMETEIQICNNNFIIRLWL